MSETKKKTAWPTIGTVRRGETKDTKEKYTYIKLENNVEILVDGVKVPLNKARKLRLEKPSDKVESLRARGIIDEKTAEERLEKLSEMPWLLYSVVAPPARD